MDKYQSELIFDLVSHRLFDNVGYSKLTDQQKEVVKLEVLKHKLI
jgi:hypothetical protein